MRKVWIGAVAALLGSVGSLQAASKLPESVPGEFVVKLKKESRVASLNASELRKRWKVTGVSPLRLSERLVLVNAPTRMGLKQLRELEGVEYAEPNWIYRTQELANDPEFGKLWGLNNTGQADSSGQVGVAGADIEVQPVWDQGVTGNPEQLVAVIDTGVDWDHPDLRDNLYTNQAEANGLPGVDDDGNGFVDDVHGWNFHANTPNSRDDHKHGTHCSGTIAGAGNNGVGVTGVAWRAKILPVKFLGADGSGSLARAIEGINYARMMGAKIMSNSWGGGGFSEALQEAIAATDKAGVLFIAAAANNSSNNDVTPAYPATYPLANIVSVAATDNRDRLASFSNYGARTVHVAAPGVRIYSTVPNGGYDYLSGTSMATPHVSGIAALLWSAHPEWSAADIKERLIRTSDPVASLKRRVVAKGRVNAWNALRNFVPVTQEPDPSLWQRESRAIESAHPYAEAADQVYTLEVPGAQRLRLHLEKFDLEAGYDKLRIETPTGVLVEEITGSMEDYTSEEVPGSSMVLRLTSDDSVSKWGFKIDAIEWIKQR